MCLDVVLIIIGILLLLAGLAGTIIPVLPGAPLAWLGLLVSSFSAYTSISVYSLIISGILVLFVSIVDNIFPTLMIKQAGGSRAGTKGSIVGLILGFFIGPVGIILGPFAGALVGEMIHDSSDFNRVLKAAFGAFKGFLLGTGLKILAVLMCLWIMIISVIKN